MLLTGGTGFIGGAVLHAALRDGAWAGTRWLCLVRAPDPEAGRARLAERLARFAGEAEAARLAAMVEVVPGDFTQADREDDPRLNEATHVLHLAADTSWWGREKVMRTNHQGAVAFARRCARLPRLERFLHVSTAMICGAEPPRLVAEDAYPRESVQHLVDYSRAKALAETSIRRELPDLPLVIARPSIVVGHSTLGAGPSASILWMFRAADRLRLVSCDLDGAVDVVPADWAAAALLRLLVKPDLAHDLYHVSAGAGSRATWTGLARAFERADPAGGPRHYQRLREGDGALLRARFAAAFGSGGPVRATMLRAMGAYYGFSELNVAFDNARLLAEGVAAPPPLTDTLAACLATSDPDVLAQFADDAEMFVEPEDVARASPARPARGRRAGLAAAGT